MEYKMRDILRQKMHTAWTAGPGAPLRWWKWALPFTSATVAYLLASTLMRATARRATAESLSPATGPRAAIA